MKKSDFRDIDFKWGIYNLSLENKEFDCAVEILEKNPEMMDWIEKYYPVDFEITDEEIKESYRQLVERLKREGIWREDE